MALVLSSASNQYAESPFSWSAGADFSIAIKHKASAYPASMGIVTATNLSGSGSEGYLSGFYTNGAGVISSRYRFNGSNSDAAGVAPTVNAWQSIVITFDSATRELTLYQNGLSPVTAIGDASSVSGSTLLAGSLSLSRSAPYLTFDGKVAALRGWTRKLSATEASDYNTANSIADVNAISGGTGADLISDGAGATLFNSPTFDADTPFSGATATLDTIPATAFPDETLTLGVTGAGATQGTGSVTINGVTQTISSWSDTSIDITVVQGDTPYGAGNTVTLTTDSGDTDTGTIELVANTAGGFGFVDMASPNTADESSVAFGATPTVVTGDQFEWEDFNTLGNLVVNAEGFVSSVDTEGAFRGRFWDATDSTWGAVETFTASIQGTVPQGTLIVQDVSVGRVSATANVSYSGTDFTRVQYSLDGQNWVNFTPPLLVVDGLERETAYTATVRVINDDGTGPTESFSFTTQTSGTIDAPVTPEDGAKYSAQRFNRQTGGGLIGLRSWKTRK